jgi:TetR/AcrR family tetracycline transcriptional repressor
MRPVKPADRAKKHMSGKQLNAADVLDGAMAVLEAEGLDGLTMRKLATHLGVQAGALYWHFANKSALLDAMADRVVAGVGDPLPPGPWDELLGTFAHRLRAALLAHRDGARVMAGTYVTGPNTVMTGRTSVDVLLEAGFPAVRAASATIALGHYVIGHTIEEQAQSELVASGAWAAKRASAAEQIDADDTGALGMIFDSDPAERFAYGLQTFLAGLRHQLDGEAGREPGPATPR